MGQLKTTHLQQKIVRFVAVGILLTGLLLSGVAVFQIYYETQRITAQLSSGIMNRLPQATVLLETDITLSAYRVFASSILMTLVILVAGTFFITYKIRPLLRQLDQSNQRQQLSEQRIHYLVHHDQLTGLPNWSQLYDSLCERMSQVAQQQDQQLAILFINLSRFKVINESLGHDAGNQVLMLMAERLKLLARPDDLLARAGGDEFLLCVKVTQGEPPIEVLAQQILDSLKQPFELEGKTIYLESTVGISLFPDNGIHADALLRHADAALTRARRLGQGRYQFYEADMTEQNREKFELETDLRGALEREEFEVYYQPQIDLQSNCISGAEA